jgi:hypothetical protein
MKVTTSIDKDRNKNFLVRTIADEQLRLQLLLVLQSENINNYKSEGKFIISPNAVLNNLINYLSDNYDLYYSDFGFDEYDFDEIKYKILEINDELYSKRNTLQVTIKSVRTTKNIVNSMIVEEGCYKKIPTKSSSEKPNILKHWEISRASLIALFGNHPKLIYGVEAYLIAERKSDFDKLVEPIDVSYSSISSDCLEFLYDNNYLSKLESKKYGVRSYNVLREYLLNHIQNNEVVKKYSNISVESLVSLKPEFKSSVSEFVALKQDIFRFKRDKINSLKLELYEIDKEIQQSLNAIK